MQISILKAGSVLNTQEILTFDESAIQQKCVFTTHLGRVLCVVQLRKTTTLAAAVQVVRPALAPVCSIHSQRANLCDAEDAKGTLRLLLGSIKAQDLREGHR